MYALAWKRHSGRLHEDLILCIRGFVPSIAGSRKISIIPQRLSINPPKPKGNSLADGCADGRILVGSCCGSANCTKEIALRVTPRVQVPKINPQLRNVIEKPAVANFLPAMLSSPPYVQCRAILGVAYGGTLGSFPFRVGFARFISSGDRDDRGSDERQQTVPFTDGEGDEQDNEKERNLSVKDADEEVSADPSTTLAEGFSGGNDDGEDYSEQAELAKDGRSRKLENERERIVSEEANAEALFWAQMARFKKEFEKRIVEWDNIDIDLATFPYYLSNTTKELLLDCVAAHLRQPSFSSYGSGLPSSNRRILLSGQPGTELYQEKLVEAIARELQASLLIIDSTVLSPHDFGHQESSSESDCESSEESRFDDWDQNDSKWEEKDSSLDSSHEDTEENEAEKHSDDESHKMPAVTLIGVTSDSADAIRRRLVEVLGGLVNVLEVHNHNASESHEQQVDHSESDFSIKKGDRVKYVGRDNADSVNRFATSNDSGAREEATSTGRQILKAGQRGRVVSVPKHMTGKVGVKFDRTDSPPDNTSKDEKKSEDMKGHNLIEWCDLIDLERDDRPSRAHTEEWFAAVGAFSEVASTSKPLIIYLPDPRQWFERAVTLEQRQEFLVQFEHKLDQVVGPVVIIAGRMSEEDSEKNDRTRLKAHLEYIRHRLNLKSSSEFTVQDILGTEDIYELFVNTVDISPPQDEVALKNWNDQLVMHKGISQAKLNHRLLNKVLELHNMECPDLSVVNLYGLHLTTAKAENVVSWGRNHLLASCVSTPSTSNGKLMIPRDSLERALTRLRDNDSKKTQPVTKDYKTAAEDEYEKALISAVIPPHEVGVKFDHIGSLEHVKQALKELVMLPLQRPELFSKGNLTRPCKGVLLFGPPGTGKTLLAKAVATEAGANFINITGSTITSKWFGDAEKLTKALFSLAKKLSPAVIFVDEVDSLLGARGGSSEHEATRKTRNEFMAAWDGLRSKDSERVLVLAATNRPFDLDDAVIRRLPRRILVDLPTAENRVKILKVILAEEDLEPNFDFYELARMTEGYSGSDLKNLSIAAAYRPIRELLDAEAKAQQAASNGGGETGSPQFTRGSSTAVIRPLRLDDFREGMTQVGASIAYDASSMNELRRWNEQYGEGGNRKRSSFGFTV